MPTTPDLGLPLVASQQNTPEITHNEAILLVQALLGGVISVGDNAPPGTPADGDAHIVGTSPTGAWAGRPDCIAVRLGGTWRFIPGEDDAGTPIAIGARHEGLRVYDRAAGALMAWNAASWVEVAGGGGGGGSYDMRFGFSATPGADDVIDTVPIARGLSLPANLAGSVATVLTDPTASFVMSLKDDGVEIATITISTAGAFTFATTGGTAKTVSAGSILTLVAPTTPDATVAGMSLTILGSES